MTTPTTNAPDRAEIARRKALRRRHLVQRQTIIFGSIIAVMAVLGIASLAVYVQGAPSPFDRDFYNPDAGAVAQDVVPCPAEGALPVPYAEITANVYNGASTTGLAGRIATALQNAGVLTAHIANNPEGDYDGVVLIRAGRGGVSAAYSVAALFPDSVVMLDPTRGDATIDVVLGRGYESMNDPAEATPDPALPLVGSEGCTPYAQLPDPLTAQEAA